MRPLRAATTLMLAVLAAVLVTVPRSAAAAEPDAATRFGACLAAAGGGDLLLLVDQSQSLQATDPAAQRVTAARVLLERLAASAVQSGAVVNVGVAGFDVDYQPVQDWTVLDAAGLPVLQTSVDAFARRESGVDTDYWTALAGARDVLADRAAGAGGSSCQALVLFTDGEFDLEPRTSSAEFEQYGRTKPIPGAEDVPLTSKENTERVERAAVTDLCRTGGGADGLRLDGVYLLAVALTAVDDPDLTLLRRLAENPSGDCGEQPAQGQVFTSGDLTDLVFAFDRLGDPLHPPQPATEEPICQVEACTDVHTFELDDSLRSVHLIAVAPLDDVIITVTAPNAEPTVLEYDADVPNGEIAAGGVTLRFAWAGPAVLQLDAEYPDGGGNWAGPWRVTFIDPTGDSSGQTARTQLTVIGDLFAGVGDVPELRAGEVETVPLELERQDGTPTEIDQDSPPSLTFGAVLVPGSRPEAALTLADEVTAEKLTALLAAGLEVDLPRGFPPGPARLELTLDVVSISGIVLEPALRSVAVQIAEPFGYPVVDLTAVEFGLIEGTTAVSATVAVQGPGCVWLDAAEAQVLPSGVERATSTGRYDSVESCLSLAAGESGQLTVSLAPDEQGEGELAGLLRLQGVPENGTAEDASAVTVPFTAELRFESVREVFLYALIGALVIGLALPLLLFALSRRYAARFPAIALQSALVPATVGPAGLAGLTAPDRWEAVLAPTSGRREVRPSGVGLRARAGWSLTRAGYAEATDEAAVGVAGGREPYGGKTFRARTGLALHNTWMLLVDRQAAAGSDPELTGQLLLVVNAAADGQQRQDLLRRAGTEAGSLVSGLRESLRAEAAAGKAATGSPSTGSPSTGSPSAGSPSTGSAPPAAGFAPTGWGDPTGPAPSGWGDPPTQAPTGWGDPPGPAPTGWGDPPGPAPTGWGDPPPGGDGGWGSDPGGVTRPRPAAGGWDAWPPRPPPGG